MSVTKLHRALMERQDDIFLHAVVYF